MKNITGTREWANSNVNIQSGCEHDCRYCYAKNMAKRFRGRASHTWQEPRLKKGILAKQWKKRRGVVMFPSSHDITPVNLEACTATLKKLLAAGNRVLIVSKPHLACIEALCSELKQYRDQILFRFTMGSANDDVLRYWEPGAMPFSQRLDSLRYAHEQGFKTSVSCEPMLDADIDVVVSAVRPYVTDAIWLGRANRLVQIVTLTCPGDSQAVAKARSLNTVWSDEAVRALFERYKGDPLIKFKDSIKRVVGLAGAVEKGLDV